jgi:tRNA(Arg) A34 adenosine deaminase TadA
MSSAGPAEIVHEPLRVALERAWQSVCARSLGIGAVVTRADRSVVATGRNRLCVAEVAHLATIEG